MPQYALLKEDVLRNEMLLITFKQSHFYDGKFCFENASREKKPTKSHICLGTVSKALVGNEGVLDTATVLSR
jgi:hypothetical protein